MAGDAHDPAIGERLRELGPRVLASLVRRYRDFATCEDAVQEALVAAATRWPVDGVPDRPAAWLARVASRRLTDAIRADAARRHREELVVSLIPADEQLAYLGDDRATLHDDALELLVMCCHPALTPTSQIALTLRAVGGLTTAEIARAFLVPEPTMAQRLARAKQTIASSGQGFGPVTDASRAAGLPAIRHVVHLVFNEGYAATSGDALARPDLCREAIRLARLLVAAVPEDPEARGLLALLLLTDARRGARTGPAGELVPLDAQDRSRWDRAAIAEGTALVESALAAARVGPFQVQAAIAALHDEAASTDATDWPQILALYGVLVELSPSPIARLAKAIARAMVDGPAVGLAELDALAADPRIAGSHRLDAARAHLLERAGDRAGALAAYRRAAARTTSGAERDYLLARAARVEAAGG